MTAPVLSDVTDGLLVITINRPDRRNAIDRATSQAIADQIDRLERAVISAPRYEDRDRFLPFALLGLVLLLLGRALGGTWLEVAP